MGPSLAPWLWVFGLTVMFGPVMLYVWETDGNQDDGDFIRWMMSKPLDFHFRTVKPTKRAAVAKTKGKLDQAPPTPLEALMRGE